MENVFINLLLIVIINLFVNKIFGYHKLDSEEWQIIKRLREIDDLEPATWREEE